ncbi:MAG: hypothetical protein ACJ77V_04535 [Chloroflexota bacterium]|jgi:hypothetical protein
MNTNTASHFDIDCPWCSGPMEAATESHVGDALACPACSIVVDLAADPVAVPVALAA